MNKPKITIEVNEDLKNQILALDDSFGVDISKKVRTLLQAGLEHFNKENPDFRVDGPKTTIPGYDLGALISSGRQLIEELDKLRAKHEKQKDALKSICERLKYAEEHLTGKNRNSGKDEIGL